MLHVSDGMRLGVARHLFEYAVADLFYQKITLRPGFWFRHLSASGPTALVVRAAIVYKKRHRWAYLHDQTPILVSDATNRVPTPADLQMVERILPEVKAPMRALTMQREQATANVAMLASAPRQELAATVHTTRALASKQEKAAVALMGQTLPVSSQWQRRRRQSRDTWQLMQRHEC